MSKPRDPVPAVQAFYCHECRRLVAAGEPVYNAGNRRICALCWPVPLDGRMANGTDNSGG